MKPKTKPRTLGELKDTGYLPRSLREEMRANLIRRLESGQVLFPHIRGYDHTVVPKIENALLSGQDMIFLGERGQGKTRLIRSLTTLLDDEIPIIRGSEVNDDPFKPISRYGKEMAVEWDNRLEIDWIPRQRRYTEKLATTDTTAAELIGEVDPVKVAEGRYLSDELTIHFGLVPRANRGIFAINELPDLAERVQVSLFNVLEERDIQIKGYNIQLPLDILVVATANPEDYTSRGRIITPLKDRYAAHIVTHYPQTREIELEIVEREMTRFAEGSRQLHLPRFMKAIIAEITFQARQAPEISQVSGVSVRMTIANMESLVANAEKRAIRQQESLVVPRISDLEAVLASSDGKLELEYTGQNKTVTAVVRQLIEKAVLAVFDEYVDVADMAPLLEAFKEGWWVEVSDHDAATHYQPYLEKLHSLKSLLGQLDDPATPQTQAAALEFVLEGLYLHQKLNKETLNGKVVYNETDKIQPVYAGDLA